MKNKSKEINGGMSAEAVDFAMLKKEKSSDELQKAIFSVKEAQDNMKNPQKTVVTEFSELEIQDVFAPYTHYKLYNRDNSRVFLINGVVLDGKVGLDYNLREKLFERKENSFKLENSVIAFYKSEKTA